MQHQRYCSDKYNTKNIHPIFNNQRECVCLHCCSLLCEATILNHQKIYCPILKDQIKIKPFDSIYFVVCIDDGVLNLRESVLNLLKFSHPFILPIVFTVERNNNLTDEIIFDIKRRFSLFQWKSLQVHCNVIVLSSFKYNYSPENLTDMTKIIRTILQLIQEPGFKFSKNSIAGFFGEFEPNNDPIFEDIRATWSLSSFNTLDSVFSFVTGDFCELLKTLKRTTTSTNHDWILSRIHQQKRVFEPMKSNSTTLKRAVYCDACNSIIRSKVKQTCPVKNTPCQRKMTPCYYCNKYFNFVTMKRHENECPYLFTEFIQSDFIVVIGEIGETRLRCKIFSNFLHHFYPKAYITRIKATDLRDFLAKYKAASFQQTTFFMDHRGKILIYLFVDEYPRFNVLKPVIETTDTLYHVHYDYMHSFNTFSKPFDWDEITPNTSLSIYNDSAQFAYYLCAIAMCEFNESNYLSMEFDPTTLRIPRFNHKFEFNYREIRKNELSVDISTSKATTSTCSTTTTKRTWIKEIEDTFGYLVTVHCDQSDEGAKFFEGDWDEDVDTFDGYKCFRPL